MTPIALTAEQIKFLDEVNADKEAVDKTLLIAMTYHSNRINETLKRERELWRNLIDTYHLPGNVSYKIEHQLGGPVIVENIEEQK
jgi:hypothetical protein